jgi:predicted kinase
MTGPPRLVVFAGLPGAGKSTLARLVAERLDAVWLRVDTLEAAILKAGIPRSFETGLAAYLGARDVGADHLELGRDVVIDAVNGVEPARRMWRDLAKEFRAKRCVIEVTCSDPEEHRKRVESRAAPTPPLPLPAWEDVVHCEYQPWTEPVLSVDGMSPPKENLRRILAYCSRSGDAPTTSRSVS